MVAFRIFLTLLVLAAAPTLASNDDRWIAWWQEVANRTVGIPYRYGGEDPASGIDCSAFVRWIYGHLGIRLPRTSRQQWQYVTPAQEYRPGYLLFFSQSQRFIDHVGIYIGNGLMLHASGKWGKVVVEPVRRYQKILVGIGNPFRARATQR